MGIISQQMKRLIKTSVEHYVQVEAADDEYTFVREDGGFSTVFEIHGTLKDLGTGQHFDNVIEELFSVAEGLFKNPGHHLDFIFVRDPEASSREIRRLIKPVQRTADTLRMQLRAILEERSTLLGDENKTVYEASYLVVSTDITALNGNEIKFAMKRRQEVASEYGIGLKPGEVGQSPLMAIPDLRNKHQSFTDSLIRQLGRFVLIEKLTTHEALKRIREEIHPDRTSDGWMPWLNGDPIPPRLEMESEIPADVSHVMHPSIARQLFQRKPRVYEKDRTVIQIGKRLHAPLLVEHGQVEPRPFSEFFEAVDPNIPWRMRFSIHTGHQKTYDAVARKTSMLAFLVLSNPMNNRPAHKAGGILKALATEKNALLATGQLSFCTWADDYDLLEERRAMLSQAIQLWGRLSVLEEKGDPIEAWIGTLPLLSTRQLSTPFPETVWRLLYMTPISRLASPWRKGGSMIFRTIDGNVGKAYPWSLGSSFQNNWNTIIFAPPGYGKSFFLAAANLALILSAGNQELPMISIIDIGPSSTAFVRLVRNALPDDKKHLANAWRMQMTPEFAVNPFDSPLGCRTPISKDKAFLVNFLTRLLTPADAEKAPERLSEFCSLLIDELYRFFSDDVQPKVYESNVDTKIDEILEKYDIDAESGVTTWWEIVDRLFDRGLDVQANLAQRYAVPNLSDVTKVINTSRDIKANFGSVMYSERESYLDFISQMVTSALTDYPILAGPTVFDIANARICAIDLMDVAPRGGGANSKKTALMYMLARQMLCKDFYRHTDQLPEVSIPKYRAYHEKKWEVLMGILKHLCMDEYHRTRGQDAVREQTLEDGREGRKFKVCVTLLSQIATDFDADFVKLAANKIILSWGNDEGTLKDIREMFGPSAQSTKALRIHANGPDRNGSSFLYLGAVKPQIQGQPGTIEAMLRLTLGPKEIWAYSTTLEDVQLMSQMTRRVGLSNTLEILSKRFPGGSCKSYLENRSRDAEAQYDPEDGTVYEQLAKELITENQDLMIHPVPKDSE